PRAGLQKSESSPARPAARCRQRRRRPELWQPPTARRPSKFDSRLFSETRLASLVADEPSELGEPVLDVHDFAGSVRSPFFFDDQKSAVRPDIDIPWHVGLCDRQIE